MAKEREKEGGMGMGLDWDGLLKWSLANSDGTRPPARQLSEEERRWFTEAMQAQTVDVVRRMKEITLVMTTPDHLLRAQGVTPDDIHDMLDELQEHVESIDMANDLHSVGGLVPLLAYLRSPHANLRAKAADVVATIVQNNPKSQHLVMDADALQPLLTNFNSDSSITSRTKALGAISCEHSSSSSSSPLNPPTPLFYQSTIQLYVRANADIAYFRVFPNPLVKVATAFRN